MLQLALSGFLFRRFKPFYVLNNGLFIYMLSRFLFMYLYSSVPNLSSAWQTGKFSIPCSLLRIRVSKTASTILRNHERFGTAVLELLTNLTGNVSLSLVLSPCLRRVWTQFSTYDERKSVYQLINCNLFPFTVSVYVCVCMFFYVF